MKKILILASNPRGDLRIDREIRDVKAVIKRSKNSEQFEVETELAVRIDDLDEIIFDNQPYIVHFCGHGAGKKGLVFQDHEGVEKFLPNRSLSTLFKNCGQDIECVLLNACYTEVQANLIIKYIPYVIGTSSEILDESAYYFSVGFYKGLVREQSIEISYNWGFSSIQRNMPKVGIELYIDGQFRKMEAIDKDNSKLHCKPLKIVLRTQKQRQKKIFKEKKILTNISPKLEQELMEEGNRKKYYDKLRNVLDNFGKTIIKRNKRISDFELKQRQTLVNNVKYFWIKGFLTPSLYFNTKVDRDKDHPSRQILCPIDNLEVISFDIDKSYEALQKTNITGQINNGKTLLILGEPGSGKTIALLQLAEKLIARTKQNTKRPIPVVFNLSSWVEKQLPLEEWLIEELKDKYQVAKTWSEPWIRDQQLTLLLDGLDEVKKNHRNSCVRAINNFIDDHLETEIVVCSRVKDYEALGERLLLSSVICIQSLSKQQLLDFVKNVDNSLLGLKTVIEQDNKIAEFAQNPLILNMMTWTYDGWSEEKCRTWFDDNKNNREWNLFELYITNNLQRENTDQNKSYETAKHWLSWLAKIMTNESKIVFLIEELQPKLLKRKSQKKLYIFFNFSLVALIASIILSLILLGIFFIENNNFNLSLRKGLVNGMLGGLYCGAITFGLSFSQKITLFEEISWKWLNSWRRTKPILICNLIVGLIFFLIYSFNEEASLRVFWEILGGSIISIPIYFIVHAFNNSPVINRPQANQGIWSSRDNFFLLSRLGFVGGFLFWFLIVFLLGYLSDSSIEEFQVGLIVGVVVGAISGIIVGMVAGGITCIQHFNLRLILWCKRLIPWNYAGFLDYASKRRLIKKVGGGYIFYHRMLMEHFAEKHQVSKR